MRYTRRALPAAVLVLCLAACGDGPTTPGTGGGDPVALVIAPGAVLLTQEGATRQLRAYTIDADGDSTEVDATFESSSPGVVAVTRGGLATGGAPIGSAQILARSGGLTSVPVLALRATPAAGALLVDDSQVIGRIEAVDPGATYQPGWRYRVGLRDAAPEVGQVVLASGSAPIAGRTVSVTPSGDGVVVVLELLAIKEMFTEVTVNERLSLANVPPVLPADIENAFDVRREPGNRLRFTPRTGGARWRAGESRQTRSAGRIEQEFPLGRFNCKAEVPAPIVFPITLDVLDLEVSHQLGLDLQIDNLELRRFVVSGGIASRLNANPLVTAALEAKVDCRTQLATFTVPVWGPLSAIIGGQVPLGVGFELGTKANFGQLGFDAFLEAAVAAEFGIDCRGDCSVIGEVTSDEPNGYFKPVIPTPAEDTRFELALSVFGWGKLAIGNRWLEELQFETVELKAGLEQKFDLATRAAQVSDAAYRSSFSLKPAIEAKSAAELNAVSSLLQINLATFAFAPDLPALAQSPHGAFVITPMTVTPGDGTSLGEMATFTVTLTNPTYLLAYAIERVEIRWLRESGDAAILEPGRPGCTDIEAAQDQISFSCQADFLEEHSGEQKFYAFVHTRIFGVPVPLPLEVANDGKATLTVASGPAEAGVTLINMWGSFAAYTQYSGAGQTCAQSEVLEQEFPTELSRTISKACSDSYTSSDGHTVVGSGSATGTYQITLSSHGLSDITAGVGADAAVTEASAPVAFLGGNGEGSSGFAFYFEVHSPVVASLGGGVTLSSPQGEHAYGRAELWSEAGVLIAGGQSGPVSGSPTLQPGRYYLYVDAQAEANNDDAIRSVSATVSSNVTLTFQP